MSRNEYIAELRHRLRRLPKEEFDSAIMYYEEYFDDAGADKEQEVISSLGLPSVVAGQLIGEFAIKETIDGAPPTAKKSMNKIWIGLLAIFASPIAFPIAVAVFVVIIALLICLLALLFSFGAVGFALLVSGVLCFIGGIMFIGDTFVLMLMGLGAGLFVFGLGILFAMLTVALFRLSFNGLAKVVGRVLIGRKNKKQAKQMGREMA